MKFQMLLHRFDNYIKKLNVLGSSPYQNIALTRKSINKLIMLGNEFILQSRNDGFAKNKDVNDFNFYASLYRQIHLLTSNKPYFEKDGYIFTIKIKD